MLVALEQKAILEKQIENGDARIEELKSQLAMKNEIIKGYEEIIQIYKDKIELYKDRDLVYKQISEAKDNSLKQISDAKDKLFEQQLKAATPTFMDNAGKVGIGAVLGAILVGLAVLF